MTHASEPDNVARLPEWEYRLREHAASSDHDITEFASATFTQVLVTAANATSRADLIDRMRRVRVKLDEELAGDVRYDEFRARLWAGCVWWRIEDPEPTREQYAAYVAFKKLTGQDRDRPNLNRRTFRHAWAGYHYRRGAEGDRGSSDLLSQDERKGRSEPLKTQIQDALVALLYSIIEGDDVAIFWDATSNTLRRPDAHGLVEAQGRVVDRITIEGDTMKVALDAVTGAGSAESSRESRDLEVSDDSPEVGSSQVDSSASPRSKPHPPGAARTVWMRVLRHHPVWIGFGALVAAVLVVVIVGASAGWFGLVPRDEAEPNGVTRLPPADEAGGWITPATWGPTDRELVSVQSRNSVVTLNSMIDNPVQGDERNFMQIRPSSAGSDSYVDELALVPGDVYVGYVYFKNDASPDAEGAVAENVRLRLDVPGVIHGSANAYARLSSDNAAPAEVWDGFTVVMPKPSQEAALSYVTGSATLHTGGAADGASLDDALFGLEGTLLGCDALDGRLPSRDECAGYVTFELRVDQPGFVVDAAARVKGSTQPYAGQVAATVGDVLEVRLVYQNTGTNQQDNVSLRVNGLPKGLRYVSESTQIANSTTGGEYKDATDGVTTVGYNLGSYQPRGNVFVKFDVILEESLLADDAGSRWIEMTPFARVSTNAGSIEAPLTVTLLRDMSPIGG